MNKIPAETVFVLPNNGNIIMAAQQCAALTEKQVVVIPTKTVPQGITAMMNVDFDAPDAQTITDAMTGSLSSVTTAQITYAARDSDFDGFAIKEGDYLALEEGKLFDTDGSLDTLLHKLAEDAAGREASLHLPCTSGRMCRRRTLRRPGPCLKRCVLVRRWRSSPADSLCTIILSAWNKASGGVSVSFQAETPLSF